MVPRIIHYCWFGHGEMPDLALKCIESWHQHMPDYEYYLWNEDNFDINCNQYVKEAYEAKKYAFVTDYVRLYALYSVGGIYMDTDVEVLKPFDDLLCLDGFVGYEGTKHYLIGTGTIASHSGGSWVMEQLQAYSCIHFIQSDGSLDLTPNPVRITSIMKENGFLPDGKEQVYQDMRIFPVDYFCPRQTTGEYFFTDNTYCDHHFMRTWKETKGKINLRNLLGQKLFTLLIKLKRKLIG